MKMSYIIGGPGGPCGEGMIFQSGRVGLVRIMEQISLYRVSAGLSCMTSLQLENSTAVANSAKHLRHLSSIIDILCTRKPRWTLKKK